MNAEYLPDFQAVYLEGSYFLGIVAERSDLRLKMLFALTAEHPAYREPQPGEQHCYREGSILIQRPTNIEIRPGKPTILADRDGSLDFGGLELHREGGSRIRVVTEWFEATFATGQISLKLT